MFVGCMRVEIVKGEFGRHELVGVHKDEDDDWMLGQEGVKLLFGSEILHDIIMV